MQLYQYSTESVNIKYTFDSIQRGFAVVKAWVVFIRTHLSKTFSKGRDYLNVFLIGHIQVAPPGCSAPVKERYQIYQYNFKYQLGP